MRLTGIFVAPEQTLWGAFVRGLVATFALAQLTTSWAGATNEAYVLAFAMGLVAVVSSYGLAPIAGLFYTALGLLASMPAIVSFFESGGCDGRPAPAYRLVAFVLVAVLSGLGLFAGVVVKWRLPTEFGLVVFGLLETIMEATTFLGDGRSPRDWGLTAVMVAVALGLGWAVAIAPGIVLGFAGVAFAVQTIGAAAVTGLCGPVTANGVVLVVMYGISYAVIRWMTGALRRR